MTSAFLAAGETNKISQRGVKISLACALAIFFLTLLCLEGFTFIVQKVAVDVGAPNQASLISSLPTIFLGIGAFVYAGLADFINLRKIFWFGFLLLITGSLLGLFFNCNNIWMIIFARSLQTLGGEAAGSCFLLMCSRYLLGKSRVIAYGIFTAGFQLSLAAGVFAGGFLATLDWHALFAFPLLGLICIPCIAKYMPQGVCEKPSHACSSHASLSTHEGIQQAHIDFVGFGLFTAFATLLLLFFSFKQPALILLSAFALLCFAVYISKAKDPFITPDFLKNKQWVSIILVLCFLWFPNLSITTTCNALATQLYNLSDSQASFMLLAPLITAALVGGFSGILVNRIGRVSTIFLAIILEFMGFVLSAVFLSLGPWLPSLTLCVYYAGVSLVYSPLLDTLIATVNAQEQGRCLGLFDLAINVTSSVGYAVFVPLLSMVNFLIVPVFSSFAAAHFSSVFFIFSLFSAAAFILYAIARLTVFGSLGDLERKKGVNKDD